MDTPYLLHRKFDRTLRRILWHCAANVLRIDSWDHKNWRM